MKFKVILLAILCHAESPPAKPKRHPARQVEALGRRLELRRRTRKLVEVRHNFSARGKI